MIEDVAVDRDLASTAVVVGCLLLGAVVVADAAFSPAYTRRVRAAVAAGDRGARMRTYRLTIVLEWSVAATATAVLRLAGLSPADIGLRLPGGPELERYAPLVVGAGAGLVVSSVLLVRASRRGSPVPLVGDIDVLVPRTAVERRWYAAVAVTAGTAEELFYRAFALVVLQSVLPGGRWPALLVAALLFGLGHAYQGVAGAVLTVLPALALGLLYLDTGSLLPGMVLHVLFDLRVLLVPPARDRVQEPG